MQHWEPVHWLCTSQSQRARFSTGKKIETTGLIFEENLSREIVKQTKTRCREAWDAEQEKMTVYASSSATKLEKQIAKRASRARAKQTRKERRNQWLLMVDGTVAQCCFPNIRTNICSKLTVQNRTKVSQIVASIH